jgi:CheY-like chemotaxis protein
MKRILVIEDEPQMRLGLRDNLELEGYEVETAADGDEGLQKAGSFTPDLVILDVMLPKKNGFDVCRDLRTRSISTPIVMLTARSAETDKVLGLELGADDYVTKPFSITELLARVYWRACGLCCVEPASRSRPRMRSASAISRSTSSCTRHGAARRESSSPLVSSTCCATSSSTPVRSLLANRS